MKKSLMFFVLFFFVFEQLFSQSNYKKITFLGCEMIVSGTKINFPRTTKLKDPNKILLIEILHEYKGKDGKLYLRRVSGNPIGGCMYSYKGFFYQTEGTYFLKVSIVDKNNPADRTVYKLDKFYLKENKKNAEEFKENDYISLDQKIN